MNFPPHFSAQMKNRLGEEFTDFEAAYKEAPPISIRLNPEKTNSTVLDQQVPWSENGFYLNERPVFTLDPLFHAGCYYVQEAGSMFIEQAFKCHIPQGPLTVLDMSAAPGGKTTHILSLLDKKSLVVANEVINNRAQILKENCQKWGHANIVVTNADPERFSRLPDFFDVILVDAPCSGEGLFRKDPKAMEEWSIENVALCASRQQRILENALNCLKPEGILIFSTCTFNAIENEENLDWLIDTFHLQSLQMPIQQHWGITEVQSEKGAFGYKFFPHKVKSEGFFMAVFKKPLQNERTHGTFKKSKSPFSNLPSSTQTEISNWFKMPAQFIFHQFDSKILAIPSAINENVLPIIQSGIHIVCCGLEVAEIKKNNLIPLPSLALSTEINKDYFPSINLSRRDALHFLAKDMIPLDDLPEHADWVLVRYKDHPLGWVKKINQRYNNYYPTEWRIRMDVRAAHGRGLKEEDIF